MTLKMIFERAAQVPKQDSCPVGGGEAQQYPRLIIELEDGVDAVPKIIPKVEEIRTEDEERTKRNE
jgi:hypothetical protein